MNVSSFKKVYTEILYDEAFSFLKKNNIKCYFFCSPSLSRIKNPDDYEKILISNPRKISEYDRLKKVFKETEKNELNYYLKTRVPRQYYNGRHTIYDLPDGKIATGDQPRNAKHAIYFYGLCTVADSRVEIQNRTATLLQNLCNKFTNHEYIVHNCGQNGGDVVNSFEYLLHGQYKPGDVVISMIDSLAAAEVAKKYDCFYGDLSRLFDRPHNFGYWCIDGTAHGKPARFNKVVANHIYNTIKSSLRNQKNVSTYGTIKYKFDSAVDTFVSDHPDFEGFLKKLKNIATKNNAQGNIGSLNMNANPFTLGHRYLVEEALKEVDHLYLFVVEEDKSEIPFKDRYEMIKQGVADLKNVTVLTTDKWMCSAVTFPDYFEKEHLQGKKLDPTVDVDLYGKYIAPAIGATKRFTGEEPFDLITRQHNNFMKNKLPQYGIKFYEIPRKSLENGDVISATKVRNALKSKDFKTLEKYVPKTTLDYLKKNQDRIIESINKKRN